MVVVVIEHTEFQRIFFLASFYALWFCFLCYLIWLPGYPSRLRKKKINVYARRCRNIFKRYREIFVVSCDVDKQNRRFRLLSVVRTLHSGIWNAAWDRKTDSLSLSQLRMTCDSWASRSEFWLWNIICGHRFFDGGCCYIIFSLIILRAVHLLRWLHTHN